MDIKDNMNSYFFRVRISSFKYLSHGVLSISRAYVWKEQDTRLLFFLKHCARIFKR